MTNRAIYTWVCTIYLYRR